RRAIVLASVAVLSASGALADCRPSGARRLIQFGWTTPDPAVALRKGPALRAGAFDGFVFDVPDERDPANPQSRLAWQLWKTPPLTIDPFKTEIDALRKLAAPGD